MRPPSGASNRCALEAGAWPGWPQSSRLRGGGPALDKINALKTIVEEENACRLPGCTIKYDTFLTILARAQSRGYVRDHHAAYVANGLRYGFDLGVSAGSLKGRRVFKNYSSALEHRATVTAAIDKRLAAGRSTHLGRWEDVEAELAEIADYFVFPLGAVLKKGTDETRPVSDHTRTGFNAACVMGILGHSLDTFNRVAYLLARGFCMGVGDVQDAFSIIPLAPHIWFFMLFRWFHPGATPTTEGLHAFMNTFGDFGTRGLPGTFKLFFVDVVVNMGRSEFIITLPLEVYVDDVTVIGEDPAKVDAELDALQAWTGTYTGIYWKVSKNKRAACIQKYIGFVWNSNHLTIGLEDTKLFAYLDALADAGSRDWLTLHERQSLAGKMERAIRTFPPGAACLLANAYRMTLGLTIPWQRRRTSRAERSDYKFVHDLLELNLGEGYYSYDCFVAGLTTLSDASKSKAYTGGGFFHSDGFYDHYVYGASAKRKPIDELEGDTMFRCISAAGPKSAGTIVDHHIDNMSYERSAEKGRSRAVRLNNLLKRHFVVQVQYCFIVRAHWIPTLDNYLADHLSRQHRLGDFLAQAPSSGWLSPGATLHAAPDGGRIAHVTDHAEEGRRDLRRLINDRAGGRESLRLRGCGPRGRGGEALRGSVAYSRASLFDGILPEYRDRLDEVFDNRLAATSMAKVMTAYNRWSEFCAAHDLDTLLKTDDPSRAGRLASWVLSMVDDTELVYASISTYVWGVRTWHTLQHEADPAYGVMHWEEFMRAVAVLTCVAAEPRREIPLDVFADIMSALNWDDINDVQFGLQLLVQLFTFSRVECPCPRNFTGPQSWDAEKHWEYNDFSLRRTRNGPYVLYVRFKKVKQDGRLERVSVAHAPSFAPGDLPKGITRDWVPIGDIPDNELFSVARWYKRYVLLVGRERAADEPMFLARDRVRPYTYGCFRTDLHKWLGVVGADTTLGPHGLRVLGYNLSNAGNGEELTVAHGGWASIVSAARYARYSFAQAASIPANMLGETSVFHDDAGPRVIGSRTVRGVPSAPDIDALHDDDDDDGGGAASNEATSDAPAAEDGGPPGYDKINHVTPSGRRYSTWLAPNGTYIPSRSKAWEHHRRAQQRRESASGSSSSAQGTAPPAPRASPNLRARSPPQRRPRSPTTSGSGAPPRVSFPDDLADHVVYNDRPSSRRTIVRS